MNRFAREKDVHPIESRAGKGFSRSTRAAERVRL
jgi:hypothetical protein